MALTKPPQKNCPIETCNRYYDEYAEPFIMCIYHWRMLSRAQRNKVMMWIEKSPASEQARNAVSDAVAAIEDGIAETRKVNKQQRRQGYVHQDDFEPKDLF